MSVVAVIPAREKSRGIPCKNLLTVGGKTLVDRSVEHALNARVDRVIVSSDSEQILGMVDSWCSFDLKIPTRSRFRVEPWRRKPELATDEASTDAVLVDIASRLQTEGQLPNLFVLLQPTSPFRRKGLIDDAIAKLEAVDADSLLSVHRGPSFVWRAILGDDLLAPAVGTLSNRCRRQDFRAWQIPWIENGSVYVTRAKGLLDTGQRLHGEITYIETSEADGVEIDTEYDLWLAEQRERYLTEKAARQA